MSLLHHDKPGPPPVATRPSLSFVLSMLSGGAAFGLLVADMLASPVLAGWVLVVLAVGVQLVALLRRPQPSVRRASRQPPRWFWLGLLVMLAAFALMRLFVLI
jgi:hypothetical protein